MLAFVLIMLLLAALFLAGGVIVLRNSDSLLGFLSACGGGCFLLAAILVPTIVLSSRAVGRTTCRHWGTQTNIPTKFVLLNWADSGTCLARTPTGRWVPNSNWAAFVRGQ